MYVLAEEHAGIFSIAVKIHSHINNTLLVLLNMLQFILVS